MTWAPAIDIENASAHASKVSISFNEGILIVTSSRICRSQRQRDSFILLKDDGDQGRSRAERRLLPVSRQSGSYDSSGSDFRVPRENVTRPGCALEPVE